MHPHLYFVSFALAGALLGAAVLLGPGRAFGSSFVHTLIAPFAFGFGAAGIASEGLGYSRWPDSLFHAISAGALLAGLSLLAGVTREQRMLRSRDRHRALPVAPPGVGEPVERGDDAGGDQHE